MEPTVEGMMVVFNTGDAHLEGAPDDAGASECGIEPSRDGAEEA